MLIYLDGANCPNCQLPRIREGFEFLGHKVTDYITEASLIYSNNPSKTRTQILKDKINGKLKENVKLIFNVLDIPEWCFPNYDLRELHQELLQADCVTSISKYVQGQLLRYFGLNSTVIYNPAKKINDDLRKNGIKKWPYRAMMVGRLGDPSKRAALGINALLMAGFKENEVAIVGSEPIGWGAYQGNVSDEKLNELYNSVDYVVMTSLGEGLGLPALEGVMGGAIPVVCHDLTTFNEFYPPEFGNYPNPYSIASFLLKDKNLIDISKVRENIGDKLNYAHVAQKILEVYEKL